MEEREVIEHKIIIDDNISASIKIPLEMTSLDLKALMNKANKLFKLSEVPIINRVPRTSYTRVTFEEKQEIVKEYNKGKEAKKKLCQKYDLTKDQLNKKVYYYKDNLGIK